MGYRCLKKQRFNLREYSLVPLRFEDRFLIMKWRNEQIYHLRQSTLLTDDKQDDYFNKIISTQFVEAQPKQILFSFLKNEICAGYGGLVHINYHDKHAELSFIMNTELENNDFEKNWLIYLTLINQVAFEELFIHKVFTYAFDLRPKLYSVLLKAGYNEEARLKDHCFFDNKFIDVLIHSKINLNA